MAETETTPEPLTVEQQVDAHNAAMLQKSIDTGKFKLPEQFKTADEFLKSYKAIQGHATKVSQENAQLKKSIEQPGETVKDESPVTSLADELLKPANQAVKTQSGIDWAKVDAELVSRNDLSPETRKAIKEAGIPDSMVEAKVRDHKSQMAKGAAEAAELVGGQDELKAILAWGRESLDEVDQQLLAQQLNGPGWKLALLGLKSLRDGQKKTTNEPKIDVGGVPNRMPAGKPQPFATVKEMQAAMADKRYNTEKAYTELVYARVLASQGTLVKSQYVDKRTRKFG